MDFKFKDKDYKTCPALAVMTCNLISFCDRYKCEINILDADESSFEFSTEKWSEMLIHKYQYTVTRDYSDLGLISHTLCNINENSIRIITNPKMSVDKFLKES